MKRVGSVGDAGLGESVAAPGRVRTGFVDGTAQPCACTGALMAHAGFGLLARPATDRRSSGASTPGPRTTRPAITVQQPLHPTPLDPPPQPRPVPLTPRRHIEGAALAAARYRLFTRRHILSAPPRSRVVGSGYHFPMADRDNPQVDATRAGNKVTKSEARASLHLPESRQSLVDLLVGADTEERGTCCNFSFEESASTNTSCPRRSSAVI